MIFSKTTESRKGFSIGEIIVVLAILALISSIAIGVFKKMNERQVLDKGISSIMSVINETRSASLSSKDGLGHGIYIEEGRLISFIGSVYNASDPKNIIYDLNSMVKITSTVPKVFVFKRTSGELLINEQIVLQLSLRNNLSDNLSITIFPTGIIQKNEQ